MKFAQKIYNLTGLFLLCISSFFCQKELDENDFSDTNNGESLGVFSLYIDSITGGCLTSVNGQYVVNTQLSDHNFILIKVNVLKTGNWRVDPITNTNSDIYFTGNGFFSDVGLQDIKLQGYGTPTAAGILNYNLYSDFNSCAFQIQVAQNDMKKDLSAGLQPLTDSSWWLYDVYLGGVLRGDSVLIVAADDNGKYQQQDFKIFHVSGWSSDTIRIRKEDENYIRRMPNDSYGYMQFDESMDVDINFCRDSFPLLVSWTSPTYHGFTGLAPSSFSYSFINSDTGVSTIVNNVLYQQVTKINWRTHERILSTEGPFTLLESWYARNIGLIYFSQAKSTDPTVKEEWKLKKFEIKR